MTPDTSPRAGLHPSIVLAAYLEPLIRGRRVAVLGDATVGLADELAQRGARLVHAYDPDPARAAQALAAMPSGRSQQVSYAFLAADLGVRDGAFDAVIVPDLSIFADATELLRRTRKLVAASGTAVIVAPNLRAGARRLIPESTTDASRPAAPPGYYELYDLVSLQFPKVRMIGQAPFVGYTVADFAPGSEPEVSVDTSLLTSSEEPEHFIAVAGERHVTLEAFTVIELPWGEVAEAQGAAAASASLSAAAEEEQRLALIEARTRLALITAELEKIRDQQAADARETETKAATAATLSARIVEIELESEAREGRLRELEGRAGDSHVRAERLANQIRDMEEELRRQRDRGTRLSKQLDDEKKARTKAEVELGMIRGLSSVPPQSEPPTPRSAAPEPEAPRPRLDEPDPSAELAAARERITALTHELDGVRARLVDLELEQAATLRRVPIQPRAPEVEAAPDSKLLHRLNELEGALNTALREAADAASVRDAALERARRGEARSQRMLELEAALLTAQRSHNELLEQQQSHEARAAEDGPRIAETTRRLAELEPRLAQADARLAETRAESSTLERRLGEARRKIAELEEQLSIARAGLADAERRLAAAEQRPADLERRLAAAEQRAADLTEAAASAEAAGAEIATLEGALRDRGHLVTSLKQDLRESERIGKELLGELESASANGVSHAAPAPGNPDELRAQLDRLAQSAARGQADLQAASWRITQLERELAETTAAPRTASQIQSELEAALAAARDEVASLRRALGTPS